MGWVFHSHPFFFIELKRNTRQNTYRVISLLPASKSDLCKWALWASRGPTLWLSRSQDQQVFSSAHLMHHTVGWLQLGEGLVFHVHQGLGWNAFALFVSNAFVKVSLHLCFIPLQDSSRPPRLSEGSPLGKASPFLHQSFLFPPHSGPLLNL